jgi:hypothetical protein
MKRSGPQPQGDPIIVVMQLEELSNKLDSIIEILQRIEARQIKTTAMVTDVKEKEAPVVGTFASSELPD